MPDPVAIVSMAAISPKTLKSIAISFQAQTIRSSRRIWLNVAEMRALALRRAPESICLHALTEK